RRQSHATSWSKARVSYRARLRESSHRFAEPKAAGEASGTASRRDETVESRAQSAADRRNSSRAESPEDSSETPTQRWNRAAWWNRATERLQASNRTQCSARSFQASRPAAANRARAGRDAVARSSLVFPRLP